MNKKYILICCFCWLLNFNPYCQLKTIYGKITDSKNTGIFGVSLVIFNQHKKIVGYNFTTQNGNYRLSYNYTLLDTLTIEISSLGYQKIVQFIDIEKTNYNFTLQQKNEILNEVVIKSGKKISIKQDTTSIKVEGFTNNTEQTVEDVLRKIPGIIINKDGSITAHGKPIDKLLIEGEDIFANNYKVLTKNLDAKVLDEVQIIDNFEDNPIFKSLNNTDKVALNLKLKKELSNVWFGNLILGGSLASENRWKESLTLGLLKNKIKGFYFGDYNNLGEKTSDLFVAEKSAKNIFSTDQIEYKTKPLYTIASNEISLFSKTQSSFNNAVLNSLSFNSKFKKRVSIRGGFYITSDNQFQNFSATTQYNLGSSPILFKENSQSSNKGKNYSAELELKFKVNKKNYITNLLILEKTPNTIQNNLLFNYSQINQNLHSNNYTFYNHFNHTVRISEEMVLNNYFYIGNNKILENLNIQSPPLNIFLGIDTTKNVIQNVNKKLFFTGVKSKLISKFKKIDLINTLQLEYNKENFENFFLANNLSISSYQNNIFLKTFNIYQENTLRYNFTKKIDFTSSLNFKNTNFNNNNFIKTIFFINPTIKLNFKKTGFGNFSLTYLESNNLPELNQLTTNFNLTDYRNFLIGTTYKNILKTKTSTFNYYFFNDEKRYSFNLSTYYSSNQSIINTSSTISNDFNFNTYIQTIGSKSFNTNISIVNYSRKLKLASKIETINSWINTPINANSTEFLNAKGSTNIIKYSGTTYFKIPINLDFSLSYNYFNSIFHGIKTENATSEAFLNINYKASKIFIIESNNSVYIVNKKKYFFNNVILNYTPFKSKFSFRMVFNNLANEKQYRYISINNYTNYQYSIQLIPRYILGTLKYRF